MVGLLTAMPALTGMLLAIPVGEFLSGSRNIVPWFARSRFLVLSCYVLTGLVPFCRPRPASPKSSSRSGRWRRCRRRWSSVGFTVVMGGVAGPGGRFTLMSRRWSILGLTNSLTVAVVGQVLRLFDFPLNYQVVFIGSAIGALISVVFSSSIRLPPQAVARGAPRADPDLPPARRRAAPKPGVRQLHGQPVRLPLGHGAGRAALPDLLGEERRRHRPADQRHQLACRPW